MDKQLFNKTSGENEDNRFNASLYVKANLPYISPTPGEFPIIASSCYPDLQAITNNMAKTLKDCGFNSGFFGSSDIAMTNGLKKSQEEGIKIGISAPIVMKKEEIVADWDLFLSKWTNSIAKYKENPALSCWHFFDEPLFRMQEKLKVDYKDVCNSDPNRMFIIVWVGWTGGVQFCGTDVLGKPYLKYLELIQENVAP